MVGVGVSFRAKGALRFLDEGAEISNGAYLEIIQKTDKQGGSSRNYWFQQDSAPFRKAQIAMEHLATCVPNVLSWPPRSPDLNIVDYCVRGAMILNVENALRATTKPTKLDSEAAIQDAFDALEQAVIKKAVKTTVWPHCDMHRSQWRSC